MENTIYDYDENAIIIVSEKNVTDLHLKHVFLKIHREKTEISKFKNYFYNES